MTQHDSEPRSLIQTSSPARRIRMFVLVLMSIVAIMPATKYGTPPVLAHPSDGSVHEPGAQEDPARVRRRNRRNKLADYQAPMALAAQNLTACVNGAAGIFPCHNIDLLSFLPLAEIGGGNGNDVWGWTDPLTGREYALMGRTSGTSFVDVTDPENPVYLGNLPTHSVNSTWRGIKVYADHAFIVSEAAGHGMQIFDLRQLRSVASPPMTFTETAHYSAFSNTHTIAVNEATGFVYAVGTNTCSGGPHIVDVRVPTSPIFAGCVSEDGYTHETQCVTYRGPDAAYRNREICFSSNEDTLTIVDVTDKAAPVQLSRTGYVGSGYTHQGWLTEDHASFLLDDERDETSHNHNTRTWIWDVTSLTSPQVSGTYDGPTRAIDHNLYISGGYAFESNYRAGLRVLDLAGIGAASLREVAYFDVYPADDNPNFNGTWSNYPFFASGTVLVSGIEQGLFVLRPMLDTPTGADLVVEALDVPPLVSPGLAVTVTDTTTNAGSMNAPASTTEFYLSVDPAWDAGDMFIGSRSVGPLVAGGSSQGATTATIPASTPAGDYYLIARADGGGTVVEANETNNVRSAVVPVSPADLALTRLSAPARGGAGLPLTITHTVTNRGKSIVAASILRFYLSTNRTYDAGDIELGSREVPPLAPGSRDIDSTTVTLPAEIAPRIYYVVAVADAPQALAETDEQNNTRAVVVKVNPDLMIATLTAPTSARAGANITVTDTTRNQGQGVSANTTTRFYLSVNATWDTGDTPLGSRAVPELRLRESSTDSVTLTIPAGTPSGAYYLIVRADADSAVAEASEINNTLSRAFTVTP